nr:DUF234 domain-containing protein [uncultured Methanolobus sp.]
MLLLPIKRRVNNSADCTVTGISFDEQTLVDRTVNERLPFKSIGRQWGKIPNMPKGKNDYELDLVALDPETKNILFCECKWQKQKINADVYYSLKEKAAHVKWLPERNEHFALISKSGFTKNLHEIAKQENVLLLTLDDYLSDSIVE